VSAQPERLFTAVYSASLAHTRFLESQAQRPGVEGRREVAAQRWADGFERVLLLEQNVVGWLETRDFLPPRSGVRYVAHGVRPYPCSIDGEPTDWQLLAAAVGHADENNELAIDAIMRDTTVAAILPTLRSYGLRWLTDMSVDEVGYPLAQAWGYVVRDLPREERGGLLQ
jgi:hypothetical protein